MSYQFTGGYKVRDQGAMHFLTFTVEGWIDLFSYQKYKEVILESMEFCRRNKGLKIHAYVIMTNHMHVIWSAGDNNLSNIIRDFKSFTSKAFMKIILETTESRRDWLKYMFRFYARKKAPRKVNKIWRSDNHPIEIYSEDFFYQKVAYIHMNPIRAGIVKSEIDYVYSSAFNYADLESVFEIDFIR